MNRDLDILILTAAFGSGHDNVAKAIKEQIEYCSPSANVIIKDLFEVINPYFNKLMYGSYRYLIMKCSYVYNYFYKYKKDSFGTYFELFYKANVKKAAEYIKGINPEIIISTFPVCSSFVSMYKRENKLSAPLITCITDVVDSCEWIHENTDLYLVPTADIKAKLMLKGIGEDHIRVTGIPVRKEFLYPSRYSGSDTSLNKGEKLNLLIMGGGFGYFNMDPDFLYWLNKQEDIEASIITGLNKKLYERLSSDRSLDNIRVYGFVDNVAELMDNSDVLISKPGGITIFEALHKHIPIVASKPKIGQEIENCRFINEANVGIIGNDWHEIGNFLIEALRDKNQLKLIRENTLRITSCLEADKIGFYVLNTL